MIELPQRLRSRLAEKARDSNRHESDLLEEAVIEYLDRQDMELAAVEEGISSSANQGLISHDAMRSWLNSWGGQDELPPPEPDLPRHSR